MFEIHPAAAKKAEILAAREGLSGPMEAMVLSEQGKENGFILFRIENDTAILVRCRCADVDLKEWLVRAALNAAANRDVIHAVCYEKAYFPLLQKLGFAVENDCASVCIPDVFNRPCAGCAGGC